ncbi:hypothetical protein EI94DRAFT_1797354 [Lactarius quietus]|nr:hypothetical protein EI94DRAFT_1797354 [Lactarius quietus]
MGTMHTWPSLHSWRAPGSAQAYAESAPRVCYARPRRVRTSQEAALYDLLATLDTRHNTGAFPPPCTTRFESSTNTTP